MTHATIRKEITEQLTNNWDFSEQQLTDLFILHLVNILMLLVGSYGCIGSFAPYNLRPAARNLEHQRTCGTVTMQAIDAAIYRARGQI
jgi:hypothetical protein